MDSITWLKSFSKEKIDGTTIVQLMKYNNYSLWWLLEWIMDYGRFHFSNLKSILKNPQQKHHLNYLGSYLKIIRMCIRKVVWIPFSIFNKQLDNSKKTVAFISTLNQWLFNEQTNMIEKSDRSLPIFNYLNTNKVLIDIPYEKELGFRVFCNSIKNGITIIPLESFIGITEIYRAFKLHKQYKKMWAKARDKLTFIDSSIRNQILSNFDFFFSIYLFITLLELEAYKSLFNKYKIDVICTFDSFGPSGLKPKMVFNNKIIGIQPGSWGDYALEYNHSKENLKTYPLVDSLLVFDKNIKQQLSLTKNFNKNKMYVVGNYKSDDLFFKIKKYNLQLTNETIVFVSQPLHDQQEFDKMLQEVFLFFKYIPNVEKVVRPHPGETSILPYEKLISYYGIKNISFSTNEDVVYPLSRAKMVIGAFSTTLSESEFLGKSTVIIDVFKKGYSKLNGNIKSVSNNKELFKFYKSTKHTKRITLKPHVYNQIAQSIEALI